MAGCGTRRAPVVGSSVLETGLLIYAIGIPVTFAVNMLILMLDPRPVIGVLPGALLRNALLWPVFLPALILT